MICHTLWMCPSCQRDHVYTVLSQDRHVFQTQACDPGEVIRVDELIC